MSDIITRAEREDAFALAALRLQMDLEAGRSNRAGFLSEYADYFLTNYDQMPTWIAKSPDGAARGMVQTGLIHRAPTLHRPAVPLLYIACVFVTPDARGNGLAEQMLRRVDAWAAEMGITRMMLDSWPKATTLYRRAGFGAAEEHHMHKVTASSTSGGIA